MTPQKLNKLRWILIVVSLLLFFFIPLFIDLQKWNGVLRDICMGTTLILWAVSNILILVFFFYKRDSISPGLKKIIFILIPVSILLILIFSAVKYSTIIDYLSTFCIYSFILFLVLSLLVSLDKIEIILLCLIAAILVGFIINRLGFSDVGQIILVIAFSLSSIGFLYLSFASLKMIKENKIKGRIFVIFYCIFGALNVLLFLKFVSYQPETTSIYDTFGVIIFLVACLTLFIVLPFSDFIEWPKLQRRSFKRLVFLPFVLFLLIFSLRFLLPEDSYKKIFFKEYSQSEIIHFDMEDYKLDFNKR